MAPPLHLSLSLSSLYVTGICLPYTVEKGSIQSARPELGHTFYLNHRFIYLENHVKNIESLLPFYVQAPLLPFVYY
jgi:hypothetical protein